MLQRLSIVRVAPLRSTLAPRAAFRRTYATGEAPRKYAGISNEEDRLRIILGIVSFPLIGYYLYETFRPDPPSPELENKGRSDAVIGRAE